MTGQSLTETASIAGKSLDRLLSQSLVDGRTLLAWDAALWAELEAQGIPEALAATIDEDPADADRLGVDGALHMLFLAGRHAAPVPIAEHMVAAWLAAQAGLDLPGGPIVLVGAGWHDEMVVSSSGTVNGVARQVPFAREAAAVLVIDDDRLAVLPRSAWESERWENTAAESRDTLTIREMRADAVADTPASRLTVRAGLACARAVQIAGALERTLELTAQYVQERKQFGRPIGKFQAVQQALAELGGQVATTQAAVALAPEAFGDPHRVAALAAAKIRAGEAVGVASRIAHQAHGAIGFTQEYELQRLTRRMWSWREDYGNESNWGRWLGLAITQPSTDGRAQSLWSLLTNELRLDSPRSTY